MHAHKLLLCAPILVAGCFSDTAYIDQVVWSDDDTQLALVELRFEERDPLDPLSGTTDKRNFRHQLYISAPDGSGREEIGEERAGQNGAELYFMRSQGYVLLSHVLEDGALAFVRVDVDDGQATALPAPPFDAASLFALPSPDGALIAQIGVTDSTVALRFLRADSLEAVGDSYSVSFAGPIDWTFRPDGALVLTDGTRALAVSPDTAPTDTELVGCTTPKTTSSPFSAAGVFVFSTGDELVTEEHGQSAAFGCQS